MTLVARKKFTFNGEDYLPGGVVTEGTLDQYQRETFLRTGLLAERVDPVVIKRKPKMTEVKAEDDELVVQ
jgi:hypothetical protein